MCGARHRARRPMCVDGGGTPGPRCTALRGTSLGYATLSGVPAQHGLYAAAAGMVACALFTTSRHVVLGPSPSTAPVLGVAVVGVAVVGFAAAGSRDAVLVAAAITLVAALLFLVLAGSVRSRDSS